MIKPVNRRFTGFILKMYQFFGTDSFRFADRTGLEPATSAVTGRHSNRLNYRSVPCLTGCKYIEISEINKSASKNFSPRSQHQKNSNLPAHAAIPNIQ